MRDVLVFGVGTRQAVREREAREAREAAIKNLEEGLETLFLSPPRSGGRQRLPLTPSQIFQNNFSPQKPLNDVLPNETFVFIEDWEKDRFTYDGAPFDDWFKAHEMLNKFIDAKQEIQDDGPFVCFRCLPRFYAIDFMEAKLKKGEEEDGITAMFRLGQSPGACVLICILQVASWIIKIKQQDTLPRATLAYCKNLVPTFSEGLNNEDQSAIEDFLNDYGGKPRNSAYTTTKLGGDNMHFWYTTELLLPESVDGKRLARRDTPRDSNETRPLVSDLIALLTPGDFGCLMVCYGEKPRERHGISFFTKTETTDEKVVVYIFDPWEPQMVQYPGDRHEYSNLKIYEHAVYTDDKEKFANFNTG